MDVTEELVNQIGWHWKNQLRPRLEGLSDDEYFWQPVPGSWTVHPRESEDQPGSGEMTIDFEMPEPDPAPVTTIAWRLAHIQVGVLGARLAGHFGAPPCDYFSYDYPASADVALARLDEAVASWMENVATWDEAALSEPVGDAESPEWADHPRLELVLHINRELIHHGAEICLLRDLYANGAR